MTKHCIDFRVMWCPHVQRKCHQLLGIVIVCHFHEIGIGGDVLDGPGGSEKCTRVGVGSGRWLGGWLGGRGLERTGRSKICFVLCLIS